MTGAVFFDVDDTLYDQLAPFAAACRAFPVLRDLDAAALYNARLRRGMESLIRMNAGEISLRENYIYRMQMGCRDLGVALSEEEALSFQAVYADQQSRLTLTPGMTRVLDLCRDRGWRLGIITNGPADHQRQKCRVLGLDRWIPADHIIVSGDCGILKPDPAIFRLAQAQAGLDPAASLYVGDSYENDVKGALGAGWQSFWLNRRNVPLPAGGPQPGGMGDEEALYSFLTARQGRNLWLN